MKKRFIKIVILCSFMILFAYLFYTIMYLSTNQLKLNENQIGIQTDRETYLLERQKDSKFYRVEVSYPQIVNPPLQVITKKINTRIQDIAFSIFNKKTYYDAVCSLEELKKDLNLSMGAYIDYNILHLSKNYISLLFAGETFYGSGSMSLTHYLTTINLKTGNYIKYNDLIRTRQLMQAIRNGYYEICEGNYNELGDGHDPALIEQFIDAIESSNDTASSSAIYDRDSIQNIGMDESSLYIKFHFEYSLDGYIILKIPLEYVELKKDINNDL